MVRIIIGLGCLLLAIESTSQSSLVFPRWVPDHMLRSIPDPVAYQHADEVLTYLADQREQAVNIDHEAQLLEVILLFETGDIEAAAAYFSDINLSYFYHLDADYRAVLYLLMGQIEHFRSNIDRAGCDSFSAAYQAVRSSLNQYLFVEVSSWHGYCESRSPYAGQSLTILSEALQVAMDLPDQEVRTQGRLLRLLAQAQARNGFFEAAELTYQQSISAFFSTGDERELYSTYRCWGETAITYGFPDLFGRMRSALDTQLKTHHSPIGEAYLSYFSGVAELPPFGDDLSRALTLLSRAQREASALNLSTVAVNARARVLLTQVNQGSSLTPEDLTFIADHLLEMDDDIRIIMSALLPDYLLNSQQVVRNILNNQAKLHQLAASIHTGNSDPIVAQLSEAYQAEITRQQVEIAQLNNRAMLADNRAMQVREDITMALLLGLLGLLAYAAYSVRRFRKLSMTDSLTRLPNRRFIYQRLSRLLREKRAHNVQKDTGIAVMLVDVDFFKSINDTFGHNAGDQTLRSLAVMSNEVFRGLGTVARFGGEEFCIILPKITEDQALELAEKYRADVAEFDFNLDDHRLTISIGFKFISYDIPSGSVTADAIISSADFALYRAKAAGRNRVIGGPVQLDESMERA